MSEVRRTRPYQGDIDRVRSIVERHLRPDLVSGFSVEFGDYDDEPAMWITFDTIGPRPDLTDWPGRRARAEQLRQIKDAIHRDLLDQFEDRYPYYRFAQGVSNRTTGD